MMRSNSEIEKKIAELIQEITLDSVFAISITRDQNLIGDLGLDSLDYASVMLSCERWLGCEINEATVNWREVQTVKQLAAVLFRSQKRD